MPLSDKRKASNKASDERNGYTYITLKMRRERREHIDGQAAGESKSRSAYIMDCIDEHEQRKAGK